MLPLLCFDIRHMCLYTLPCEVIKSIIGAARLALTSCVAGQGRFSNGPTWIEYAAAALGVVLEGCEAVPSFCYTPCDLVGKAQ